MYTGNPGAERYRHRQVNGGSNNGIRLDKPVVFDLARYAEGLPSFDRFDPNHADPALQRRRAAVIDGLVGRNTQHTNHMSARHQRHWRKAVKSGTAQVFGDRFERLSGIYAKKANGPVYLGPRTLPAFGPAC